MDSLARVSSKGQHERGATDNPAPKEAGASAIIISTARPLAVSPALNGPLKLGQSKSTPPCI